MRKVERRGRGAISAEDFVVTWQKVGSVSAVAEATGLTAGSCSARAQYMRKIGIPLKKMHGNGRRRVYAVKALTKLAKSTKGG